MRPGRLALCELVVLVWLLGLCWLVGLSPAASVGGAAGEAASVSAIVRVFGRFGPEALRVSWCESRWSTVARNGQYLGLFQMGAVERRRYGHGASALVQARAAHRYFVASGRDWSPWSCKP